jgi:putative membrane protein
MSNISSRFAASYNRQGAVEDTRMSEAKLEARNGSTGKSLVKGLVAGLLGGLAGTIAKTFAERMFPPRTEGQPEPTQVAAESFAGHPLDSETREIAGEAIHWGFGAVVGAAYGALAEYYPVATAKEGASFGIALEALTHESALPALGFSASPGDETARERTSEVTTHVVYGVVTETVRAFIRRLL